MTHKKYKLYTLWLLIITITALVVTAAMLSLKRSAAAAQVDTAIQGRPLSTKPDTVYYTPNPAPSQENSETLADAQEDRYLITVYRGRIGVFQEGKTVPVLVTDTEIYLLPEEDVQLLKKGITAKTLNEAKGILEDYD